MQLPSALSVAELARRVKGSSTHLVNYEIAPGTAFNWQAGYGSVSVSPRHLSQVSHYISHQREHHANDTLFPLLEQGPRNADSRFPDKP